MTSDIHRRIENLIRFGLVEEVDYQTAHARVKIGKILTAFLPFATFRTGTTISWSPPTIGEAVIILAHGGELNNGVILTGLYTSNNPSSDPSCHLFIFPDGAEISYNHEASVLNVTGIKKGNIKASESLTAEVPEVNIKGNVNIVGNLAVAGSITTTGGGGSASISGTITATGDILSNGISLQNHVHQEQGDGNDTSKAK